VDVGWERGEDQIDVARLVDLAPAIQSCRSAAAWSAVGGLSPAQISVVAAAYRQVEVVVTLATATGPRWSHPFGAAVKHLNSEWGLREPC
jgi:hypothetical protein